MCNLKYTEEEMQEAVVKVERSFGGTLKRLKEENEKLQMELRNPTKNKVTKLTLTAFADLVLKMSVVRRLSVEIDVGAQNPVRLIRVEVVKTEAFGIIHSISHTIMPIATQVLGNMATLVYLVELHEQEVPE